MASTEDSRITNAPARETIVDLVLIGAIAALLAIVHVVLSESWKTVLAFDHASLKWWAFYTSSLIHEGYNHLLNNVLAYLLAAVYTYWLCQNAGLQRWFRRSFIMLLVLLPPLTVGISYLITGALMPEATPSETGFSGVASGFAGSLHIALVAFIGEKYDYELGSNIGISVLILLLLVVGFVQTGFSDLRIYALGAVGITLVLGWHIWEQDTKPTWESLTTNDKQNAVKSALAVVVLATLVYSLFPAELVRDGTFINIFSHFAGYIWAIPITAATLYLWR